MFPEKNILTALTGKSFSYTKYKTIKNYNINLNEVSKSILSREHEFIKCSNISQIKKVLSKCLRAFNIETSAYVSDAANDPYWIEGEYDAISEKVKIIFCSSVGKQISINSDDVKILSFYIPCIIAHECGHILQHYKNRFKDLLWYNKPSFSFTDYVYDLDYLLEDIEMDAFAIQMILEYKCIGVLPTYHRYLSLFKEIKKKCKSKADLFILKREICRMNNLLDKHSSSLGYKSIKRIKFKV